MSDLAPELRFSMDPITPLQDLGRHFSPIAAARWQRVPTIDRRNQPGHAAATSIGLCDDGLGRI